MTMSRGGSQSKRYVLGLLRHLSGLVDLALMIVFVLHYQTWTSADSASDLNGTLSC